MTKIAGSGADPESDPAPLMRCTDLRIRIRANMTRIRNTGFPNPWRFTMDPDPWPQYTTLRIRFQPRIRILLISSVSFKTPKFFWLITYRRYNYIRIRIANTDPNPGEPNQCGSESTRLILRQYRKEVTDLMMLKTSTLPPKISKHEALLYIPSETCRSKHFFYNCRQKKCDFLKTEFIARN